MHDFKHYWQLFSQLRRRMSDAMYVPTATGSHDMGDHYLGNLTSAYVEFKNFPDAGRQPFHRIQIKVVSGSNRH